MPQLPAKCLTCGHIFPSGLMFFGSSTGNRAARNFARCPKCGNKAYIMEGTFDVKGDAIHFQDAPPLTRAMLADLQQLLERSKSEAKSPETLIEEIATVSPALAGKLQARGGCTTPMILMLLSWIITSVTLGTTLDLNKLIDQAYHLVQGQDPNAHDELASPEAEAAAVEEATISKPKSEQGQDKPSRQQRRQLERQQRKHEPRAAQPGKAPPKR